MNDVTTLNINPIFTPCLNKSLSLSIFLAPYKCPLIVNNPFVLPLAGACSKSEMFVQKVYTTIYCAPTHMVNIMLIYIAKKE